jgi:hypothetical protein
MALSRRRSLPSALGSQARRWRPRRDPPLCGGSSTKPCGSLASPTACGSPCARHQRQDRQANQLLQPHRADLLRCPATSSIQYRRNTPRRHQASAHPAFTRSPVQTHQSPAQCRTHQTHRRNLSLLSHPHPSRRHRSLLPHYREHTYSGSRMTNSSHKTSGIDSQGTSRARRFRPQRLPLGFHFFARSSQVSPKTRS